MASNLATRCSNQEPHPAAPIGLARLAKLAFDGNDLAPIGLELIERITARPDDAAALMDLSIILQLTGDRATALGVQRQALELRQTYRQSPAITSEAGVQLLLSGHHHLPVSGKASAELVLNKTVLVVHAGTAVSTRTRGAESNSYNLIRLERGAVGVAVMEWADGQGFHEARLTRYEIP